MTENLHKQPFFFFFFKFIVGAADHSNREHAKLSVIDWIPLKVYVLQIITFIFMPFDDYIFTI